MKKLSPMLATLYPEPFDDSDWIFEIKWDGYRAFGCKDGRSVQILSRGKKNYTNRFQTLADELKSIQGTYIIDGEIVILDKNGVSNFQMLQNYIKHREGTPYFYAFDILMRNGEDLRQEPLIKRKKILKPLLKKLKHIRFSKHILAKGKPFFKAAEKHGLEGIIAKKKGSEYFHKRTKNWLKIKTKNRQEVVIGGFTEPKGTREKFGALLIGVYKNKKLQYAGRVGGGFNRKLLSEVYKELKKHIRKTCPFENPPKVPATWLKPKLVCEVEFTEWTNDGKLRHPIFKGLRSDKAATKVVRE